MDYDTEIVFMTDIFEIVSLYSHGVLIDWPPVGSFYCSLFYILQMFKLNLNTCLIWFISHKIGGMFGSN